MVRLLDILRDRQPKVVEKVERIKKAYRNAPRRVWTKPLVGWGKAPARVRRKDA